MKRESSATDAADASRARRIHGVAVFGSKLDRNSRCAHWHSELDIVAIKMACCQRWYACVDCHREQEDHDASVWPLDQRAERAVLCGACGTRLRIEAYLDSGDRCPSCGSGFNPGCRHHYHLYFETSSGP